MKNWLKNMFSKNDPAISQEDFRELFVADQPPVPEPEVPAAASAQSPNYLENFLNQDYQNMGYNDGYTGHSRDLMEAKIRTIKSEYREILDRLLETYQSDRHQLRVHVQEIKDLGNEYLAPIHHKLEQIDNRINKLVQEKDLSVVDEGLIMKPINRYREGFLRGLKNYQNENILFSDKGLFNY